VSQERPAPRAPGWTARLRSQLGLGVATVAVTVPFQLLLGGDKALFLAFAVLCVYPILAAPLTVAPRSWTLAAAVSFFVWLAVFTVLVQTADALKPMRESAMVFLLPSLLFPPALLVSGLVRWSRRGRDRQPGVRIAGLWIAGLYGLALGVPWAMDARSAMIARRTGNTPANTVMAGSTHEVARADAQQLDLRTEKSAREPASYRITPETRYGFMGSGPHPGDDQAGPAWLKQGQKVSVDYVFRDHVAQARRVTIWVDRTGCAGDAKWTAMPPAAESSILVGSTWEGWRGTPQAEPVGDQPMVVELLPGGRIAYTAGGDGVRRTEGGWRKKGPAVLIQLNDCFAEYEGRLEGDRLTGEFSNERGFRQPWTARRVEGAHAGPAKP